MTTGDRMRLRRKELGVPVEDIAAALHVSVATVYRYEKGDIEKVPGSVLDPLATILKTTPAWLMGWDVSANENNAQAEIPPGFQPMPPMTAVPLVGQIACGDPITAEENLEGVINVPEAWSATFVLTCHGDSMEPKIKDGDLVAIRKQEKVENGQIAAVRIDNEATLKKVYLYPDRLELRPINPDYESIVLYGDEINTAAIEGRAVGLCRGL